MRSASCEAGTRSADAGPSPADEESLLTGGAADYSGPPDGPARGGSDGTGAAASLLDPALCVRCNSCASLCPTYDRAREEGMSARGRMALLDGLARGVLEPSGKLDERIFSCVLCGACSSLCPRAMDITGAVYAARKRLFRRTAGRRLLGQGVKFALKRSRTIFRCMRTLRGLEGLVPLRRLKALQAIEGLDISLSQSPLREGSTVHRAPRAKGRVALFTGCTVNYLYPRMGRALIDTLNRAGYDVVLPKGEVCCGAPLLALGLEEEAAEIMSRNVAVFGAMHVEAVISLCPTCISFITKESERLIGDSIGSAREVSRFLLGEMNAGSLSHTAQKSAEGVKVLYHDPCHTLYHLKARKEPRALLASLGYTLTEPKNRGCCGFGGTFRLFCRDLSEEILRQRIEDYSAADMIVTSCPNCVLQFRARMKGKEVRHIIEVVAERTSNGSRNKGQ